MLLDIDINKVYQQYSSKIGDLHTLSEELYRVKFGTCFTQVSVIRDRIKCEENPINHTELEWVLIELPLELFTVAESLNNLRLELDVLRQEEKSKIYAHKLAISREYVEQGVKATKTEIQEQSEFQIDVNELRLLLSVYQTVITRVENEIGYAKELIMGAKKVWDNYKQVEESTPIGEVVPEPSPVDVSSLPVYTTDF